MNNEYILTPRFGRVRIKENFSDRRSLMDAGYTEPTYYEGYIEIRGKSLDMYHMVFAACPRT